MIKTSIVRHKHLAAAALLAAIPMASQASTAIADAISADMAIDIAQPQPLIAPTKADDMLMDMLVASGKEYAENKRISHIVATAPVMGDVTYSERKSNYFKELVSNDTRPGVEPYGFWDDVTITGLPLIGAGLVLRGQRENFRQDYNNLNVKTRFINSFHNEWDNYTQFMPMALSTVLNVAGVEGRSQTPRYLTSTLMSYAIMAAIVNPIKHTAKEMRPDGSTANSFPSGHTATAFVSATILHKEYGLTRSPWYSIGGYAVATGTGIMRVLNNRHWVSDIFAGAGIGILSTELAYGLSDLIFKGKGLTRNNKVGKTNPIEHPTFFSVQMGMAFGSNSLEFDQGLIYTYDPDPVKVKFHTGTAVGVEGAYFFNKYVGVGGRFRIVSTGVDGWEELMDRGREEIKNNFGSFATPQSPYYDKQYPGIKTLDVNIESDHLTEFTADAGLYFNLPLSRHFALGTKLLVGRSIYQALDINATTTGFLRTSPADNWVKYNLDGLDHEGVVITDEEYTNSWDLLTITANNTTKFGTGLSLTWAYKQSVAWKIFCDYDYSRKEYTAEFDALSTLGFIDSFLPTMEQYNGGERILFGQTIKQNHHRFVLGGSLCITF